MAQAGAVCGSRRFFFIVFFFIRKRNRGQARSDSADEAEELPAELTQPAVPDLSESTIKEPVAQTGAGATAVIGLTTAHLRVIESQLETLLSKEQTASSVIENNQTYSGLISTVLDGTRFIHENTKRAFEIANNLAGSAEQAFALSGQVQAKVSSLADDMARSLSETEILLAESQKISGILEIMNELSSRTHVLSINASVVAAREGTHGRAFDVVAREIRKLAENTESSLKNIKDLIDSVQAKVKAVAEMTRTSSSEIVGEKNALLSVAGALQGAILAVEVIRTVSGMSSDKAMEQERSISALAAQIETTVKSLSQNSISSQETEYLKDSLNLIRNIVTGNNA